MSTVAYAGIPDTLGASFFAPPSALSCLEPDAARRCDVAVYDALFRAPADKHEGYFVLEDWRLVHISAALCGLLGTEPSQIVLLSDLTQYLLPGTRSRLLAAYRARLRGMAVSDCCEIALQNASGSPLFVELTLRTLEIGAGRTQTLVEVRNITEQKRAEEARLAALAENARLVIELRQAARQQRIFLRDMLHLVTEGRLRLCESPAELPSPPPLAAAGSAPDAEIALSAANLSFLRRAVERAATAAGIPAARVYDLMTAAGEAAMNAIVHAQKGVARVFCDPASGRVQVWVEDRGEGIALSHLHRATLEQGFTTAGTLGQGFGLALQMADRLYLLTGSQGTTVVLEQFRVAPPLLGWGETGWAKR